MTEYWHQARRRYIQIDWSKGVAAGDNLYYECLRCAESIPSLPVDSVACSCENIAIDVDCGRVHVDEPGQLRAFLFLDDGVEWE